MSLPIDKGNELEDAVRAIETAILKSSPALKEKTFSISQKKILVVDGVRHEIDVWVDIGVGSRYDSVYIFECKNWEKKVGKTEIIDFQEKINVSGAMRGFFVAKGFTSSARAQAKKNKRIVLLTVTSEKSPFASLPFAFHWMAVEVRKSDVIVSMTEGESGGHLDFEKASCFFRGGRTPLESLLRRFRDVAVNDRTSRLNAEIMNPGVHEMTASTVVEFEPGELLVNGADVSQLSIDIRYNVHIVTPVLQSQYEVKSRGRVVTLLPFNTPWGASISARFVQHGGGEGSPSQEVEGRASSG